MTDVFVGMISTSDIFRFGLIQDGADLKSESGIRSAVLYSLFTDRLADPDDVIPDGSTDRRGHWADGLLLEGDISEGSKLWLLKRSPQTNETLQRANQYAREALQWFIGDGVASTIQIESEWRSLGVFAMRIVIYLTDSSRFSDVFMVTV